MVNTKVLVPVGLGAAIAVASLALPFLNLPLPATQASFLAALAVGTLAVPREKGLGHLFVFFVSWLVTYSILLV